jgi:hypothetical protein
MDVASAVACRELAALCVRAGLCDPHIENVVVLAPFRVDRRDR